MLVKKGFGGVESAIGGGWGVRAEVYIRVAGFGGYIQSGFTGLERRVYKLINVKMDKGWQKKLFKGLL